MGKYSKISGNTFYRNFPTRPTYGGLTVFHIRSNKKLTRTISYFFTFRHIINNRLTLCNVLYHLLFMLICGKEISFSIQTSQISQFVK